ncbi:hypothetical protein S83_054436 [Arachis hypogaea]
MEQAKLFFENKIIKVNCIQNNLIIFSAVMGDLEDLKFDYHYKKVFDVALPSGIMKRYFSVWFVWKTLNLSRRNWLLMFLLFNNFLLLL